MPSREDGETITTDALIDLLRDQPVGQQDVLAFLAFIKNVKRILPVWRMNDTLDDVTLFLAFELFQLTGGQVIAVRENQPVPLRQEDAGLPEGIGADRLLSLLVKDEVGVPGFPYRA